MKQKQKYGENDVICKENKKRQHVSWLNQKEKSQYL